MVVLIRLVLLVNSTTGNTFIAGSMDCSGNINSTGTLTCNKLIANTNNFTYW
jgi:hypothetical protein